MEGFYCMEENYIVHFVHTVYPGIFSRCTDITLISLGLSYLMMYTTSIGLTAYFLLVYVSGIYHMEMIQQTMTRHPSFRIQGDDNHNDHNDYDTASAVEYLHC